MEYKIKNVNLNNCLIGNHNFICVYNNGTYDEEDVVRWCPICGTIRVDKDIDGHPYYGYFMGPKAPSSIKNIE